MTSKQRQAQFDAAQTAYRAALYAKNEVECLRLVLELADLAKGTPYEARQAIVLKRHQK